MKPLLLHASLAPFMWEYAILYFATLILFCLSFVKIASSQEFLSEHIPNISHLQVFGCCIWVPILEPQYCSIGAHQQKDIYVGFNSPSIIYYINPSIDTLLCAHFANCRCKKDFFFIFKKKRIYSRDF